MARIAIVDDSRLARTLGANALSAVGHAVRDIEPASLFDVLKSLRDDPPALLVMDFLMPNCPGPSLARACKDDPVLQAMKIVVVTAHVDRDTDDLLLRLGVRTVLRKPISPKDLQEAVAAVLGGS